MSASDDEESVAEELEESLNESLEEDDYSDDNYSEDNYSAAQSSGLAAAQTSAINLDDLLISPVPLTKNTPKSGALLLKNKDASKNTNMTADYDGDDYSLSFDEDSENNTIYSQDFDISAISMSRGSPSKQSRQGAPPLAPKQQQSVSFQPQQTSHILPSLAIQSLEAENAMEKLSKEIVYLRNQQRIALKNRRVEALAKKRRAEERRKKHQEDLTTAHQEVTTLQLEKRTLEDKVRVLELSLLSAEESKTLISGTLDANKEVLLEQKQAIEKLQAQLTSGEELLSEREAEWNKKEVDLIAQNETMRVALVKAELHVAVLVKSNEAAEERLARDRSTLPGLHQDLLDERLRHLAGIEESAQRREEAAQSEQAAAVLMAENMRKELHAEIDRREVRLAAEINDKRDALAKAQEQFRFDVDKHNAQKVEEASQREKELLIIRREELQLVERERVLAQRVNEFNVAKQVMEPELLAAQRDREEARELQRQGARVLQQAQQQERRAEVWLEELQVREEAVDRAWRQLERERGEVHSTRSRVQVVARGSARDRALLEEEREKLRGIAVELTSQFHVLQRAALLLNASKTAPLPQSRALALTLPERGAMEGACGVSIISQSLAQAVGEVATNALQLERAPQYSGQELELEEEEEKERSEQVTLLVEGRQKHKQRSSFSPEQVQQRQQLEDSSSGDSGRFIPDIDLEGRRELLRRETSGSNEHNSHDNHDNTWDSLECSAMSHSLPPPPPVSDKDSHQPQHHRSHNHKHNHNYYHDRNNTSRNCTTKENVNPSEVQSEYRRHHQHQPYHRHHDQSYSREQDLLLPRYPCSALESGGTGVQAVKQSTEALKSAALRFGVTIKR